VRPEKISIGSADQEAPAGTNSVMGLLRMSTYIGVSHQYKIEMPGAHELTVYVQNLGAGPPPAPGEKVRLSWLPEHTFAVEPAAPISEQEEVE
jgi:spermidine/putrescine transport system ATP-binding protein